MLARVTSGKNGVIEYLQNGVKKGRDENRNELDNRVVIDGNITITSNIIDSLQSNKSNENYLHITLGFQERDIDSEKIKKVYHDYKNLIFNAYDNDEYNIYAEIHFPKIKSYINKSTGDRVERYPHVHIVIPQKNLLTDKALKPFGLYKNNIKYHDAIQEFINRKHGLTSPYDHKRVFFSDRSDFISRYKGDLFKDSHKDIKKYILNTIEAKDIRNMDDFKTELSRIGKVSIANKGTDDEYLKIKIEGYSKNVRLKESYFKADFIKNRLINSHKPSDNSIDSRIKYWTNIKSHETKLIHAASKNIRNEYYILNEQGKEDYLNERKDIFNRKYREFDIQPERRKKNREFSSSRNEQGLSSTVRNGLPSMSERNLVRTIDQKYNSTKSLLPDNANNNLEQGRTNRDYQLRRSIDRNGLSLINAQPKNTLEQTLQDKFLSYDECSKNYSKINPINLLDYFEKNNGLIRSNYSIDNVNNRIKIEDSCYNCFDFSRLHMNQSSVETISILNILSKNQNKNEINKYRFSKIGLKKYSDLNTGIPLKNILKRNYSTNTITNSNRITYKSNGRNISLNSNYIEAKKILSLIMNREKIRGENMKGLNKFLKDQLEQANTITSASTSLKESIDSNKRKNDLEITLRSSVSDLIPAKNVEKNQVDFYHKDTGKVIFSDLGNHIQLEEKKPSMNDVSFAIEFAAEKFGRVEVNGTKEFKRQVVEVAAFKNLNIIFADKKMQESFLKEKNRLNNESSNSNSKVNNNLNAIINSGGDQNLNTNNPKSSPVDVNTTDSSNVSNTKLSYPILLEHGEAPYKNNKENDKSYFIKTSDGKTHWGIGLKDALESNNIKTGDQININKLDPSDVKIPVPIKNEKGEVVSYTEKVVQRNNWEINKINIDEKSHETKSSKDDNFDVSYKYSDTQNKMQIFINGNSPKEIPDEVIKKIHQNDRFLNSYSLSEIKDGYVDMSKSNAQAVPKVYTNEGNLVEKSEYSINMNQTH